MAGESIPVAPEDNPQALPRKLQATTGQLMLKKVTPVICAFAEALGADLTQISEVKKPGNDATLLGYHIPLFFPFVEFSIDSLITTIDKLLEDDGYLDHAGYPQTKEELGAYLIEAISLLSGESSPTIREDFLRQFLRNSVNEKGELNKDAEVAIQHLIEIVRMMDDGHGFYAVSALGATWHDGEHVVYDGYGGHYLYIGRNYQIFQSTGETFQIDAVLDELLSSDDPDRYKKAGGVLANMYRTQIYRQTYSQEDAVQLLRYVGLDLAGIDEQDIREAATPEPSPEELQNTIVGSDHES